MIQIYFFSGIFIVMELNQVHSIAVLFICNCDIKLFLMYQQPDDEMTDSIGTFKLRCIQYDKY